MQPKLQIINSEIHDLNEQIAQLCDDLESDSGDFINLKPVTISLLNRQNLKENKKSQQDSNVNSSFASEEIKKKPKKNSNYSIDMAPLKNPDTDEDAPYIKFNRKSPKKHYKPLKDRILDSAIRKEKKIDLLKHEEEKKFQEEYTFHPFINAQKNSMYYNPEHLYECPKEVIIDPSDNIKMINSKSKKLAEENEIRTKSDFLQRNFRSRKTVITKSPPKKKISRTEEKEMIQRLSSKPSHLNQNETVISQEKAKKSDPEALARLVSQSMQRAKEIEQPHNPEETFRPKFDPNSKRITKGISPDLYKESLAAQERARQRAEEVKKWREISERAEYEASQVHSKTKSKNFNYYQSKRKIAGMDEFVQRMKKKHEADKKELESENREIPKVIAVRPFSFDKKPQYNNPDFGKQVDQVLAEIDYVIKTNGF